MDDRFEGVSTLLERDLCSYLWLLANQRNARLAVLSLHLHLISSVNTILQFHERPHPTSGKALCAQDMTGFA